MSRKREYYLSLAAILFVIALAFFSMIGTSFIPKYSMPLTYLVQNLAIILIILITRKTIKYGYLQSDQTWPAAGLGILFISVVAAATVESLEIKDHWVMILNQLMLLFWAPIASSMVAGAIMNVIPLGHVDKRDSTDLRPVIQAHLYVGDELGALLIAKLLPVDAPRTRPKFVRNWIFPVLT